MKSDAIESILTGTGAAAAGVGIAEGVYCIAVQSWLPGVFAVICLAVGASILACARKVRDSRDASEREIADLRKHLELDAQKYRLVAKLFDDVLFEFNLVDNTITDSTNWEIVSSGDRFVNGTIDRKIVHPDDVQPFVEYFRGKQKTGELKEIEIRLRVRPKEDYHWTQIKGIVLGDKDGKPEKIVGRRQDVDKQRRERDALREKAERDMMTGLYNKNTSELMMKKMLSQGGICALLIIDVDRFKDINDKLGHQAGDEVLKDTAREIRDSFRDQDVVGRIGGDEFAVLMCGLGDNKESIVEERCGRIIQVMQILSEKSSFNYQVTCSIGAAFYPEDGNDYRLLFEHADEALYEAKRNGRNRFEFYSREK